MHRLHLILIDDHQLFRNGLRMVLETALGITQIQEYGSIEEALVAEAQPDLVLLDILLNGMDGLSGLRALQVRWPDATFMVVAADSSSETAQRAIDAGAHAFVAKNDSSQQMLDVIRKTLAVRQPRLLASVDASSSPSEAQPLLSDRQLQVLNLMSKGLSNRSIGQNLYLSEHTIRWHVHAILEALGASSRTEAVFLARERGLLR